MDESTNFRVRNVVLCEDIRQEKSNKFILIGVYAGNILVETLPCDIPLSLFIDGTIDRGGESTLFIRLSGPGEGSGTMGINYSGDSGGAGVLVTPRMDVHMECAGVFRVEVSEDRITWTLLRQMWT